MRRTPSTQADTLRAKCRRALASHRADAAKDFTAITYSVADLIDLAKRSPTCFYCRAPLSFGFEFDHKVPIARTPQAHRLDNLCCACHECNAAKGGGMDAEEFGRLLELLRSFNPHALADVRRRLISGGRRYSTSRRCGGEQAASEGGIT